MPDKAISFGLHDKTYISPRFQARQFLWSAYNRVKIEYIVASEPDALEPVKNPHFTYHPRAILQLSSGPQGPKKDFLFQALADVPIALMQDGNMPWIRATSGLLSTLPTGSIRKNHKPKEDLVIEAPSEDFSMAISVDFVLPDGTWGQESASSWKFEWGEVGLRVQFALALPQIPTLGWFHSY